MTDPATSLPAPIDAAAAPTTTSAVVAAARQDGEAGRTAWAELYRLFAPMVHGVLLARGVRPTTDADDLTHEVFLNAMRARRGLKDDHAAGPWLAAIARNAATDHARGARRTGGLLRLVGRRGFAQAEEQVSDGAGEKRRQAEQVLGVILTLPEAYHETLVLRLVEGLTGPQIATSLGMTHGSVRVNLGRGMEMLRAKLNAPRTK